MRFKRSIKLLFYRLKDQKAYYSIPFLYIFAMAGLAFMSLYHHTSYLPRDEIYKLLHVFAPFFVQFWILPIVCERTDGKWGEFFISCRTDTVLQIMMHNIMFALLMLPVCCMFSAIYGDMLNIYIQMLLTNFWIQGIGIAVLYLSFSVFSAYGIPFLYSCLTMFSLMDSESIALGYVTFEETTMSGYLAAHWWKMMLVLILITVSVIKTKR